MIELRTLGVVSLGRADGVTMGAVLTEPKRLALLTYLAVATPRGFHRRDTLLALFWPDLDTGHARSSLRRAVHVLNHVLSANVILARGRDELGLNRGSFWCDALSLEVCAAQGHFIEAVQLYEGEFLRGFHIHGAPEFERWCENERARLRQLAWRGAWTLASRAVSERRVADAARWARLAATLAPWDESVLSDFVIGLVRIGNRAAALHLYDEIAQLIERDTGVRPSAMTRQLIETIKTSGGFGTAPAAS